MPSCQICNFQNEPYHLIFINSATTISVKLVEALLKVVVVVVASVFFHVVEGVFDEQLRLLLVKVAIQIGVVLRPDLINTLSDQLVNLCLNFGIHFSLLFQIFN